MSLSFLRRPQVLQIAAIDAAIIALIVLMSGGGDALDLFHIAFLLLVVEAFLMSSRAFWPRVAIVLAATWALMYREGDPPWQDLAEPVVLATIASLVFFMHTSRDRVRAMLREQATHDPLTGLLNRRALQSHLDDAVKRLHRDNAAFAVIYIDLDGFKLVNDVHGHDVGDLLLIEASHRIQQRMQQDDLVGRIGGDEFALLIGSTPTHDDAEAMAQHLLDDIEWPFVIGEATITISASMGIAMASPANTQSTKELLGDADRAMYSVKKAEKGAFAFSA